MKRFLPVITSILLFSLNLHSKEVNPLYLPYCIPKGEIYVSFIKKLNKKQNTVNILKEKIKNLNTYLHTYLDKLSTPTFIKLTGKTKVYNTLRIKTMEKSSLYFYTHKKGTYIFKEKSEGIIHYKKKPKLIIGSIIYFPSGAEAASDIYRLDLIPEYIKPGTTALLTIKLKKRIISKRIFFKGKRKTYLYYKGYKNCRYNYIMRIGTDCMDKKKELKFRIYLKLQNGITIKIRDSFLYQKYRTSTKDIRSLYSRRLNRGKHFRINPRTIDNGFFKFKELLLPMEDRINKPVIKHIKGKPYFPPLYRKITVKLPGHKLALYRDRAGIRRETRIHQRAVSYSSPRQLWRGNFIYPSCARFSSIFGELRTYRSGYVGVHRGIDIASFKKEYVKAPNNGIIRFAGNTTLAGKNIVIDHGQYIFSKIFHMSRLFVRTGQYVTKGRIIGKVGNSGISTGPHVHWEMWVGNIKVDPGLWVHGKISDSKSPIHKTPNTFLYEFLMPRY